MWALGDYPTVASTVIPGLGAVLVAAAGITAGDRVLDVAAGTGNAAIPAALIGADVVACDLTPELLAPVGSRRNKEGQPASGTKLTPRPFRSAMASSTRSSPAWVYVRPPSPGQRQRACQSMPAAAERSGSSTGPGRLRRPDARRYQALRGPPPAGTLPPPLWGDKITYPDFWVRESLDLVAELRTVTVDCFPSPEAFRDFFKSNYGPTVAAYRGIADDPRKVAALDADLVELARRHDRGAEGTVMNWQYLLVTARRR